MKKSVSRKSKNTLKKKSSKRLLEVQLYFPSLIYTIELPDYLDSVKKVSDEYIKKSRKTQKLNKICPVIMSGNYFEDPRISDFVEFVGGSAWNILNDQGYDMQGIATSFTEMWTQEHHKLSSMEQHVHGFGSQIVGMYFLEVPEDSSNLVFYDPRAGKVMADLPELDFNQLTPASKVAHIVPKPGLLVFTNAWLAHSFTRHAANTPLKFVHFNLTVQPDLDNTCEQPQAEVV